jgi:hypothetical protein
MTAPIDQGTLNMKYKIRGNSRRWLNILYGCICRDCNVAGFTITYVIGAYRSGEV